MSMRTDSEDVELDEINVTPMVDLFMVLMLIFIIMTTTQLAGLKVHLPTAKAKSNLDKDKTVTKAITVSNDGKIFMDSYPVSLTELEQKLAAQKAQTPDMQVVVRGDDKAEYQKVVDVLDILQRQDITKVGLAIKGASH